MENGVLGSKNDPFLDPFLGGPRPGSDRVEPGTMKSCPVLTYVIGVCQNRGPRVHENAISGPSMRGPKMGQKLKFHFLKICRFWVLRGFRDPKIGCQTIFQTAYKCLLVMKISNHDFAKPDQNLSGGSKNPKKPENRAYFSKNRAIFGPFWVILAVFGPFLDPLLGGPRTGTWQGLRGLVGAYGKEAL